MTVLSRVCVIVSTAFLPIAAAAQTYPPLPALNIDIAETSVSGLSSGAFMAVQLGVAYSSIVKGVGVVAGGPYYCAQDSVATATTQCSCTIQPASLCAVTSSSADVPALVTKTKAFAASHLIDDTSHLGAQRVITMSGASDTTVPRPIVQQLADYYAALGVPSQNRTEVDLDNAGHTMPTVNYGVACAKTESPFIGKCNVDAAEQILRWIYGPAPLAAPATTQATRANFLRFDQTPYLPADRPASFAWSTGMDTSGWLYVPAACKTGTRCRLHVALHGCEQGQDYLPLDSPPGGGLFYGTTFVRHAGYARWAETNRIVVLFPQAVSIPGINPNGCWDWWGYTGAHFADRQGVQMRAIRNMIDRLAAGATP